MNKQNQYKNIVSFIFSLIIIFIQTLVWSYVWITFYASNIMKPFGYKGNWLVILVYIIILFFFTKFYGGYKIGYYLPGDVALSGILSIIIANVITYFQASLISRSLLSVFPFLIMTFVQSIAIVIWAIVTHKIYLKAFPPYSMLLIYGGKHMARSLIKKLIARGERYIIQETISSDEGLAAVKLKIMDFSSILIVDVEPEIRSMLIKYCFEHSKRTYVAPKISEIILRGASDITLFDTPLILNENQGISLEQSFLKRTIDILFSIFALIITSPFMLLTILAIKLYDHGPVIYKQKRLTLNGKEFYIYKFRSMILDAETKSGAQLATKNDERITPIGKIIRAIRFDELPQLWNILKGDMSLVGPRPERPEIAVDYMEEMPEFNYRLKVKAGLTGYAQVYGKYNTTPYDKLKLDLIYITNYSLFQDIKIMFMTLKILFIKESTEGIG